MTVKEQRDKQKYIDAAHAAESKYGLPRNLLVGVMGAESNFNPNAISPVGARGLMQFMPATAKQYGIDPLNPEQSIDAAGQYLASSYKQFGNWDDSLRSYNMGVGGLKQVKAGKKSLPKETQEYTGRVYAKAGIKYDEPSYANNVAPYLNQQQTTTAVSQLQIPIINSSFAGVSEPTETDTAEKEDKQPIKEAEEVKQQTNEYNFLKDYQEQFAQQQEQQPIEIPTIDVEQTVNEVSQFVDSGIVAQQGRQKLDTGHYKTTTGKVVVWGTPEYREAYDRGEVVTDKGVKSPVTMKGQKLKEVVVQNNYKRGFWEKYKDKIVEENKDAGVLGAIVGTPISAVASLPQLAMMEGLTGKMQRPSEAMDIQNPYGAMAVDAVTDPANLIGAGVLTKEKVLAGLARSTEDGLLSNAYKLNPNAFKANPEAYYRMIGDEGLADLQNVGYVRSNPNTFYKDKHPFFSKGYPIDGRIGKSVVEDSKYLGNNMIEVSGNNEIGNRFVKNRWADAAPDPNIFVARDKIGIDNPNLKIFEKDWLQGYKQVEVPKTNQDIKTSNYFTNPTENISTTFKERVKSLFSGREVMKPNTIIPKEELDNIINRELNYVKSKEYITNRVKNTGEKIEDVEKEISQYEKYLDEAQINIDEDVSGGSYYRPNNTVRAGAKGMPTEYTKGVVQHEVNHLLSPISLNEEAYKNFPIIDFEPKFSVGNKKYNMLPEEQQVRYNKIKTYAEDTYGKKRGSEFNDEDIKNLLGENDFNSIDYNPYYEDASNFIKDIKNSNPTNYKNLLKNALNESWAVAPIAGASYLATQGQPQYQQGGTVKSDNEWLQNWYQNRVIPNKDIQGAYLEDKPIYLDRLKNIPPVTKVNMIDNNPNKTGQYNDNTGQLLLTPKAQPSVYTHEVNHYLNQFPSTMRTVHENIVEQNMYKKGDPKLGRNNEHYDYLRNPDEIHSRIQVLRKDAGFKPNEEVTQEKLLKYLQNYKGNDENILQIMNLTDEKGLLDMLNYMAYNPKKEKGNIAQQGVIKDQEGQRKYPNQPTEIKGNKMATDGYGDIVLYTIPDKGSPKIVMPNTGEHVFKGATKFTEYPITKEEQMFLQEYLKYKK